MKQTNKHLIFAFALSMLASYAAIGQGTDFIISGTIRGLEQDTAYFERPDGTIDAVKTVEGKFIYKGKVDYPDVFTLYSNSRYDTFVRIFVEGGSILVEGNAASINKLSVKGSKAHIEYTAYRMRTQSILDRLSTVDNLYENAIKRNRVDEADSLAIIYQQLADERLRDVLVYASEHRDSRIVPYITSKASIDSPNQNVIEQIFQLLDIKAMKSSRVASIKTMLSNLAKTTVGAPAPPFNMILQDGRSISLSNLRGKVLLVDFWASWCGPCRLNHPDLVELYRTYKGPKFELISISLDKNQSDWKKSVEKDGMTWLQYCDLLGAKGIIARNYGIEVIPASFLIDQNGNIAAKNIHGKLLREQINKLLK